MIEKATFGAQEARDLLNTFPPGVRLQEIDAKSEPLLVARVAFIGAFVNLERAIHSHRDGQAELAASMAHLREVLDRSPWRGVSGPGDAVVAKKVKADRDGRRARGELKAPNRFS
jgi:hypothetical protein